MKNTDVIILDEYTTPDGTKCTYFCVDGYLYEETEDGKVDRLGKCDECDIPCYQRE